MVGAIDIGGTKIAIGLVTRAGRVAGAVQFPTQPGQPYVESLDHIEHALRDLMAVHAVGLAGLGIGMTGRLNADGVLTPNAFLPLWSGRSPARDLASRFGVPAAIENDADAAALAEHRWGVGSGVERLVFVTVSTGIGGGIVLGGRLYRGVGGAHPEIGHHVIDPIGPACFCGARGCWEVMASGTALASWVRQLGGGQNGEELGWDARQVCDQAERGHPVAQAAVAQVGRYLGIGIANLMTLFAPDCIVLGGGLMQRWDLFRGEVMGVVQQPGRLVPWQAIHLIRSQLTHPGLAGAAAVGLQVLGDAA